MLILKSFQRKELWEQIQKSNLGAFSVKINESMQIFA